MYKIIKIILIGVLILLMGGSFGWTFLYLHEKSQKPAEVHKAYSPTIMDLKNTVLVAGMIIPREEIMIKPKIPGIISKIYVQPGDCVKKDVVLAKISVVPDQSLLNEGYNRYNKAKINLLEAKQKLNRRKLLHNNNKPSVSTENFENVKFEYEIAKSDLEAAKNNLKIIKEGGRDINGNQSLIRSTISGTILEVPVKVGDTIIQSNTFNEGTTIAIVADMKTLVFEGDVDESDVGKIKEGMILQLKIGAIENREVNATLVYIAPKGNNIQNEGQVKFKIKADIEFPPDILIRAGYSANAEIILAERKSVLSINESCLKFDKQQRPYVELQVNNQHFERRDVKLGLSDSIHVEILEGLSLNDKIK